MRKRTHRGSDFRDFLKEQGIPGKVEAHVLNQGMNLQSAAGWKKTSHAAVDQLLDASNPSVTLNMAG